jgi:hypothetical protein
MQPAAKPLAAGTDDLSSLLVLTGVRDDSTQSIASRAGPKGLERMGNQYQYTQNDQKTDNIRQHQQFSRARPIERA